MLLEVRLSECRKFQLQRSSCLKLSLSRWVQGRYCPADLDLTTLATDPEQGEGGVHLRVQTASLHPAREDNETLFRTFVYNFKRSFGIIQLFHSYYHFVFFRFNISMNSLVTKLTFSHSSTFGIMKGFNYKTATCKNCTTEKILF